jgi:hypothetical protein
MLLNQLQSAIKLPALKSQVISLETFVKSQAAAAAVVPLPLPELEPIPPSSKSLTQYCKVLIGFSESCCTAAPAAADLVIVQNL